MKIIEEKKSKKKRWYSFRENKRRLLNYAWFSKSQGNENKDENDKRRKAIKFYKILVLFELEWKGWKIKNY